MTAIVSTKFLPTALAAAAIGLGALMTLGTPSAHASERSDCESTVRPGVIGASGTPLEVVNTDAQIQPAP